MKNFKNIILGLSLLFFALAVVSCGKGGDEGGSHSGGSADISGAPRGKESFQDVVKRRGLNEDDVLAAAKTYTPDNIADEYVTLNSGGQEGNTIMYSVPSMRMLKYVPTNTRQPYAGFGYSVETDKLLKDGYIDGQEILWGDTHHPGFSETDGDYNNKWAAINDKANPRLFVYDLKDWSVKQVIKEPIFRNIHGGAFFTPNSEYIMSAAQYPAPFDRKFHPLTESNFRKYWRGGITYWKFDNDKGRIIPKKSFAFEFPPYTQDLSDAGKNASYGYGFTNSLCTEMYYGGIEDGRPPFEAGCSSRDVDYMHITLWAKAEKLLKAGKIRTKTIHGMKVIPMSESIKHGLVYLIPEPKSPHGVDVDPTGDYIIVAGKLDSHAWVYSVEKIKKAIAAGKFEHDSYGLPVIPLEEALHGSVEVGLGPLHNQYDKEKGIVYTSIYVDSRITKWDYINLKVLEFVPSHYNVGHLVAAYGDTKHPHGKYLISLNKLSIDRFNPVGPLHPQNHQLIDISGKQPKVIYDMPLPMGEPHYTAMLKANASNSIEVYPVGTNSATGLKSPYATTTGGEKRVNKGNTVEIFGTISNGQVNPANIEVNQGQNVLLHLTNVGQSVTDHYVYEISAYDKMYPFSPGETATIQFKAEKSGAYPILLDEQNKAADRTLVGYLNVKFNQSAENNRVLAYTKRINKDNEMQAFKPSAVELANLLPGENEYLNHGCNACHKFGREFNGPDLLMVDKRRDDKWLKEWIMDPASHLNDPDVEAMRQHFKLAMPNQNVSSENASKIIAFLKAKSKQVMSEGGGAVASTDNAAGQKVFDGTCVACHKTGVTGAPMFKEKDRWAKIKAQGLETVVKHATEGFTGKKGMMPAKGGNASLSDADIKAAVQYMLEQGTK